MRRPLVAGNWKMHGSRAMASALVAEIASALPAGADVAVLPPFPYVAALVERDTALGRRLEGMLRSAQKSASGDDAVALDVAIDLVASLME